MSRQFWMMLAAGSVFTLWAASWIIVFTTGVSLKPKEVTHDHDSL